MNHSDQLRRVISESGHSCNALGLSCGLSPRIIQRFVAGKAITSDSIDKLAEGLDLRLVELARPSRKRKAAKP